MSRRQCRKCPWRVDVDPNEIPNGYCSTKHAALSSTIAKPGALTLDKELRMMACHESPVGREMPCIGWLHQQLGTGNNIGLRLAVLRGQIDAKYTLVGEQHETLEDTLPKEKRR